MTTHKLVPVEPHEAVDAIRNLIMEAYDAGLQDAADNDLPEASAQYAATVDGKLNDALDEYRAWTAAFASLSASPEAPKSTRSCDTCQGNGELVTDWDKYKAGELDASGNEYVKDCPDCDGTGEVSDEPPPSPDGWQDIATAHDWVDCPICGEPDMRQTKDEDEGTYIHCVNTNCASNGGTNAAAMKAPSSGDGQNLRDENFSFDAKGTLMIGRLRTHLKYTCLGDNLHYGCGTREGKEMGEPYPSEAAAKAAIISTARAALGDPL